MENRWILIIAVIIVLACVPLQVTAYINYNIGGHPSINKFAVLYFEEKILPKDPLLKNTSIRGEASYGYAWDETDDIVKIGPRNEKSIPRKKLLHQWIEDGGFSADEPEYTMALVHFYDPKNPYKAYLTDQQFLVKFGELYWDGELFNPERSAVDWAFDRDLGSAYYIQDYSWNDGLRYYQEALADDSLVDVEGNYGRAWRAVGETMHLVSDMTVPAHVRNDGHAWSDPYEESVKSAQVYAYKDGPFLDLDYDHGTLQNLMVRVATVVNENFYSADTMPILTKTSTGSEYTCKYQQPSLEGLTADANGYYYSPVPRVGALAREEPPVVGGGMLVRLYRLDEKVLNAQRSVLIPTAIRASAEVLDRFLPRFEARLSVEKYLPDDLSDTQYLVRSTLKQVHSEPDAWSGYDLIVRNGAYLVEKLPEGREIEYLLSPTPANLPSPQDPNFNNWQDIYNFIPGTKVYMYYDLGGYVIKSNEVEIPEETPTTTPDWNWEREPWVETTHEPTIRMCGDIPCSQLPSPGRVSPDWTPPPIQ